MRRLSRWSRGERRIPPAHVQYDNGRPNIHGDARQPLLDHEYSRYQHYSPARSGDLYRTSITTWKATLRYPTNSMAKVKRLRVQPFTVV